MGGRGGGLSRFTNGTVEDLKQEGIVPVEGIRLKFYCDDGNDKGEADYLLFDGQITFKDGEWWASVDGDRFWHESDES